MLRARTKAHENADEIVYLIADMDRKSLRDGLRTQAKNVNRDLVVVAGLVRQFEGVAEDEPLCRAFAELRESWGRVMDLV